MISWGSANDIGKSLKVIVMFLKMCLLFGSFLIRSCWLSNGSPVSSEAQKMIWAILLQYLDKAARPSSSLKTSFWRIDHLGFWVCHFRVSLTCVRWYMFRTVLWVVFCSLLWSFKAKSQVDCVLHQSCEARCKLLCFEGNFVLINCICIVRITESVISCKGVRWDLKYRSS